MARELLIATNPARRRRSPAQRRAALANLRKARAARKGSSKRRRRRNPAPAAAAVSNPRRRRRRTRRRARAVRRYRNPARRLSPRSLIERQLIPAAFAGAGAVANDLAYNLLLTYLPLGTLGAQLQTGPMRHVGKAASALALSFVAGMVLPRRTADLLGAGALTVVGYNAVKDVVARVAPSLPLGCYDGMGAYIRPLGYAGAGYHPAGTLNARYGSDYRRSGLAAYIQPRLRGLGNPQAFGVPTQLSQPNPFTAMPAARAADTYSEDYGT